MSYVTVLDTRLITVVTPTIRGREEMLAEAVESVKAQTVPAVHLIELDSKHAGPGATLNKLVPRVDTEWVSILADDDLYDPDHLESLSAEFENADIVLSWSRMLGSDRPQHRGEFVLEDLREKRDTGMRGCFLFRKSLYEDLGGWPVGWSEDWQFLISAADSGARIVPVYRETWTYRQHSGSLSAAITKMLNGEMPDKWFHLPKLLA